MIYTRHHSIEISSQHYIDHFGSLDRARQQCFNIGAGTWQHEAWTNIDLPPQSKAFAEIQAPCLFHDLVECEKLPIEPNSAEFIFTSHVIEHLPDDHANKLFASACQALKQGGVFRVVTGPDADTDFAALMRKDDAWWYFYEDLDLRDGIAEYGPMSPTDKWLFHLATPRSLYSKTPCQKKYSSADVEALIGRHLMQPSVVRNLLSDGLDFNKSFPGDHLSWWNSDKLIQRLLDAGFSVAKKSAYGQSSSAFMRDLRWFDTTYPHISVYVEAVK
jgi:SAM-dependent methyltransferase